MTTPKKPEEKEVTGLVISDPKDGTLFIGEDVKQPRTRQVQLLSQSGAHLKLFQDGGFELHGRPCDLADNIDSNSVNGLNITGNNIRLDAKNGTLTLAARIIRFESTASDETLVFRSSNNIEISAADTIKIDAANIAIGARNKLLMAAKGPIYIKGQGGVTIVEPRSTLIPTSLSDVIDTLIDTLLFGGR